MKILGIHDGHNSGATLLVDGKISASVSEERLTRNKNEIGYPKESVNEVLSIANLKPEQLDRVIYASNFMHTAKHLSKATVWYNSNYDTQIKEANSEKNYKSVIFEKRKKERISKITHHLNIPLTKIGFIEHHLAHGAAAYFGSPFNSKEPILIMTCDGAGDGVSATISIAKEQKIQRISETSRAASLGKIYSRITYLLGFKPWEHEYKIMGLAPYCDEKHAKEVKNILNKLLKLSDNGLNFKLSGKLETSYCYEFLKKNLERKRFDSISGGLQMFTEELLSKWVQNAIKHTGINKVVFGGGVFMNVKANKIISEIKEIKQMFVFPSCGDESLSFGAVWHEYARLNKKKKNKKKIFFSNLYLGREYNDKEIFKTLKKNKSKNFRIKKCKKIEKNIAEILANNKIIARFSGRMEWGARSLGNRSILANPSSWANVEKINSMIKMRDFWMPFAPSILIEDSDQYIKNPKKIQSSFMMHAFDTKKEKYEEIIAAIHPRDKTARAQLVSKKLNPSYWELIKFFKKRTGSSTILNTSFNLHGYPLVNTPEDALYVFLNSGLEYMALGNFLITKKS